MFFRDVEINEIGDYKIPKHGTDQNTLEILIGNMKKNGHRTTANLPQNIIFILKLVMLFLLFVQEESNKHFNSIKFIYEQLNLMTQNKLDYPTEMVIFSSLFYNCSPKEYLL